jgi:hypothetical protein
MLAIPPHMIHIAPHVLIGRVEASGKNLTHIFASHGHAGRWFTGKERR